MAETRALAIGRRTASCAKVRVGHFMTCRACGQRLDMRDLAAVLHHEVEGHRPLSAPEAQRLVTIEAELRCLLDPTAVRDSTAG